MIMVEKQMTNEENYRFDVAGYLIVPGVLTAAGVFRRRGPIGSFFSLGDLRGDHPVPCPRSDLNHGRARLAWAARTVEAHDHENLIPQ